VNADPSTLAHLSVIDLFIKTFQKHDCTEESEPTNMQIIKTGDALLAAMTADGITCRIAQIRTLSLVIMRLTKVKSSDLGAM
jgi:hypothetical protein